MNSTTPDIWDPIDDDISKLGLETNLDEVEQKYGFLLKHPNLPRVLKFSLIVISLISFGIYIYFKLDQNNSLSTVLLSFPIVAFSLYLYWIGSTQLELSKKIFAAQKSWLYSPKEYYKRSNRLISLLSPLIDNSLATGFRDEFWGKFKDTDIWMAEICKARKHAEPADSIYVFRLLRHVATDLAIVPERKVLLTKRFRRKTDLDLESSEFNRLFHITYNNREINKNQKLYEVLNPAVMADLIDLRYAKGEFGLLIKDNILAICFSKQFQMSLKYTNFFKKVAIDDRDIKEFDQKISSLLNLGYKVVDSLS